jgi:hypothetical protein
MQTQYKFEQLPLISTPECFTAAHIDGVAEIDFGRDGLWRVKGLEIEVGRVDRRGDTNVATTRMIVPTRAMAQSIELTLLSDPWSDRVQTAVNKAITDAYSDPESSWIKRLYTRAVEV